MSRGVRAAVVAVGVIVVVGLVWLILRSILGEDRPTPPISAVPDTVADEVLVEAKPDPGRAGGIGRRLTTHAVGAERQRVSRGTPDTALVRRYAQAVADSRRWKAERDSMVRAARAAGDSARADSLERAPSTDSTGNRLPPVAGKYDGKRLALTLSRADGSILEATAKLAPHWEFSAGQGGASDTLVLWREDRWWARQARELGGCAWRAGAPVAGLAAAVSDAEDRARNAVIGGLVALGACLAD